MRHRVGRRLQGQHGVLPAFHLCDRDPHQGQRAARAAQDEIVVGRRVAERERAPHRGFDAVPIEQVCAHEPLKVVEIRVIGKLHLVLAQQLQGRLILPLVAQRQREVADDDGEVARRLRAEELQRPAKRALGLGGVAVAQVFRAEVEPVVRIVGMFLERPFEHRDVARDLAPPGDHGHEIAVVQEGDRAGAHLSAGAGERRQDLFVDVAGEAIRGPAPKQPRVQVLDAQLLIRRVAQIADDAHPVRLRRRVRDRRAHRGR